RAASCNGSPAARVTSTDRSEVHMAHGEVGQKGDGAGALRAWLVEQVALEVERDPARIDPHAPVSALGSGSAAAVTITVALERHTGLKLSPALAWDHPTIDELARHVAGLLEAKGKP